jgi:hypothetical protein
MKWLNPKSECEWREKVITLADAFMRSPFFLLFCIFFFVYSIAAINGYVSSSLHLLNRRTRQLQNGKRRNGPLGRFMADNCRLYETMGHFCFCLNFLAKVIYLERTNEWKFYPTNTKGMTITTKTIGPSLDDAHSNIYSDFYFYRFLFAKRKRRQCCSSLFKKEKAFEMEYLFSAWTWIVNERSAGLVTCRVPKVFPRWGKSVAHSQKCECGQ